MGVDGRRLGGRGVVAPGTALATGGLTALSHSLHVMSLALDHLRSRLAAELRLNAIDVSAVIEVYNHPGIRPTDLGRALHMGSAGLTALCDRLERAGFLRRVPDPSDRRGSQLQLTSAGTRAAGWLLDAVTTMLGTDPQISADDTAAGLVVKLAGLVDAPTPGRVEPAG